jgi:hypothetical protein
LSTTFSKPHACSAQWLQHDLANISVAFEVVKRFVARQAAVHAFAGGGAKLAYQFGMI